MKRAITTFIAILVYTISLIPQVQVVEQTITLPDQYSGILSPTCVEYSPSSNLFYLGGTDGGYVIAIDGATNQKVARIETGFPVGFMGFNPVANKLYCAEWGGDDLAIIDCNSNSLLNTITFNDSSNNYSFCFNSTENKIYIADYRFNGKLHVVDGETDQLLASISSGSGPFCLAFNPTANKIYCGNQFDANIVVIDGASDQITNTISLRLSSLTMQ